MAECCVRLTHRLAEACCDADGPPAKVEVKIKLVASGDKTHIIDADSGVEYAPGTVWKSVEVDNTGRWTSCLLPVNSSLEPLGHTYYVVEQMVNGRRIPSVLVQLTEGISPVACGSTVELVDVTLLTEPTGDGYLVDWLESLGFNFDDHVDNYVSDMLLDGTELVLIRHGLPELRLDLEGIVNGGAGLAANDRMVYSWETMGSVDANGVFQPSLRTGLTSPEAGVGKVVRGSGWKVIAVDWRAARGPLSTPETWKLLRNGSEIAQLVVPAGSKSQSLTGLAIALVNGDELDVAVTAADADNSRTSFGAVLQVTLERKSITPGDVADNVVTAGA